MDVTSYLLGKNASGGGSSASGKISPTTLNLDNSTSDIINTQAIDTSRLTSMSELFKGCINVEILDLTGWDYSQVIYMTSMFNGCTALKEIKGNVMNAINVVSVSNMFSNCPSLEVLPFINLPKPTSMTGMFYGIGPNLTDESLDNILKTCINATSYKKTKSLYAIGLISNEKYTNERIQSLPHYQDFINAGWTTGY